MTDKTICKLISARIKKTDKLLDIGCGDGYLCKCIAGKVNQKVIGLDISNDGFEKAHTDSCEELGTCHLVECRIGEAEKLDSVLNDEKFDVVTFIHSFHHLNDVQKSIEQTKKYLKPSGKILIAEYSVNKGKQEDTCDRYTIDSIVEILIKNFTKIVIEQPETGFYIFTVSCLDC